MKLKKKIEILKERIRNEITLHSQSNKKDWKWKSHNEKKRIFEIIDEVFAK